jgi:site-specific recombinase XerD
MANHDRKPVLLTPDLERYIEKVHHKTREQAEAKAAAERALREAWNSHGGRAFRRFVETRPAWNTQRTYTCHVEDFLLWLARNAGRIDPLDAMPEDLARYEKDVTDRFSKARDRRLSLRTRQDRIRTIRTAYQFCVDEDLLDRSPARHVRIRGRADPARAFLTDEQALALLRACEGKRIADVRDRSLVTVLLHTGLRAAEAAALKWGDLSDTPDARLTIEGKGRVVRTVPLSDEARSSLRDWARAANSRCNPSEHVWGQLVFRVSGEADRLTRAGTWHLTSTPLRSQSIYAIVKKRARRAGLAVNTTPHTLRRTFATKLKRLGVAIDTIQRYLGHSSIQTTVKYFDPRDEDAVSTVRTMHYGS